MTAVEPVFEVLSPGLLTTVQDTGRHGFGHLGVPTSGACDSWSLAVSNALVGNDPGAAALECTLLGPELRALRDVVIAVAGADFEAEVRPSGRRVIPGSTVRLAAGEVLALPAAVAGVRSYVAVPGGIDVPVVLDSRSTCLVAGFGGFEGRPLRAGDVVSSGSMPHDAVQGLQWSEHTTPTAGPILRILAGPDADAGTLSTLVACPWSVSLSSDRRGVRLTGQALTAPESAGERLTIGVLPGAVQLPPDGQPIVLLADAQPTGGYAVVAVVVEADLPIVGQLATASELRFEVVSAADARVADRAWRAALDRGRHALLG